MALLAQLGPRPRLSARDLVKPIGLLMLCVGLTAVACGLAGYAAARSGVVWMNGSLAWRVPAERHSLFLADAWAHFGAYASGFLGGILVWVWAWKRRLMAAKS